MFSHLNVILLWGAVSIMVCSQATRLGKIVLLQFSLSTGIPIKTIASSPVRMGKVWYPLTMKKPRTLPRPVRCLPSRGRMNRALGLRAARAEERDSYLRLRKMINLSLGRKAWEWSSPIRNATHPQDVLAHIRDFNVAYLFHDQVQGLPTRRTFYVFWFYQFVLLAYYLVGTHVIPSPTCSSRAVFNCFAALGYFFAKDPEAPLT